MSRLNPFPKKDVPGEVASEGERIPIIAFDQKVEAAEGLKGADFFLPDPVAVSECGHAPVRPPPPPHRC